MSNRLKKQPSEEFTIEADFTNSLETAETINLGTSSISATKFDGTDATTVIIDAATLAVTADDKGLTVLVKGGVETDSPYTITFLAVTSEGNTFEIDVFAYVKEVTVEVGGELTLAEMLSLRNTYLGDEISSKIPPALGVKELNQAQRMAILLLERDAFHDLEVPALENQSLDSDGAFDLSSLFYPVLGKVKGLAVKLNGGIFCIRKSFDEYRSYVESGKVFDTDDPIYYVWKNKIYPKPANAIDIYQLREPVIMELGVDEDSNINCELDEEIQNIILGLSLKKYVDKSQAAATVYADAMAIIEAVNSRYTDSESAKFGHFQNKLTMPKGEGHFDILNYTGV